MDTTPIFGVTMIPEVPSNPQLTLVIKLNFMASTTFKNIYFFDRPSKIVNT